jgi:hypothetical protein
MPALSISRNYINGYAGWACIKLVLIQIGYKIQNGYRSFIMDVKKKNDDGALSGPLKLDYRKTFKVGFAFAIILLFWQAYDFVIPLLLENAYGLSNAMRGFIMGLDNLLSLFMLPLFGRISDKSSGRLTKRFGKRTPFIVFGTIAAALLMVFIPIAAQGQLIKSTDERAKYEALFNDDAFMQERLEAFYDSAVKGDSKKYCDLDYLKRNGHTDDAKSFFTSIRYDSKLVSSGGFMGLGNKTYTYGGEAVSAEDAAVAVILKGNND